MESSKMDPVPLRRVIRGKSMNQNGAMASSADVYANMTSQAFAAGYAQGYGRGHQDGHLDGWSQRDAQACSCTPEPNGAYCAMPGCNCDCGFKHLSESEQNE